MPLVRAWGGVAVAYRKRLIDAPAYRLNHEEVIKALEEGIAFVENLNPMAALPDARGAKADLGVASKLAAPALTFSLETIVEAEGLGAAAPHPHG